MNCSYCAFLLLTSNLKTDYELKIFVASTENPEAVTVTSSVKRRNVFSLFHNSRTQGHKMKLTGDKFSKDKRKNLAQSIIIL